MHNVTTLSVHDKLLECCSKWGYGHLKFKIIFMVAALTRFQQRPFIMLIVIHDLLVGRHDKGMLYWKLC